GVERGLGRPVEDVQDLEVGVRVHRRHVPGLGGLDAGADRGRPLRVADDRLVVGERAERDDFGVLQLDDFGVDHRVLLEAIVVRRWRDCTPRVPARPAARGFARRIPLRPRHPWGIRVANIYDPRARAMVLPAGRNPEEEELLRRAMQVLPGGVLGGYYAPQDLAFVVREARGARLRDCSGREYVDYILGSGPLVLGHAHPAVVAAVEGQLR